ncbi:MAG: ribosome biogenesis GTP-binding protein YihA/YsxC [Bacteroidia bacterium]|nr:ribosome biogenesis GTP-binding protein YihA/YsxC [Bacteroidia bacterium]MDW8346941.1 ribosome biogenesis GTP-binding protein YihA/YsxC [Bacteroidia bacterium]
MHIQKAEFILSTTDFNQLPEPKLPEYAFIGRSNVGKSSLINMIVGNNHLARTSRQPGKTQTMVVFKINQAWYLTDLPGYGYAKVPKTQREQWQKMTQKYILERKNLVALFVLIDIRISPQKIDLDFINQLGRWQVPFTIAFTKADKVSKNIANNHVKAFLSELSAHWEEMPTYFITSAQDKTGRQELLDWIETQNRIFNASLK